MSGIEPIETYIPLLREGLFFALKTELCKPDSFHQPPVSRLIASNPLWEKAGKKSGFHIATIEPYRNPIHPRSLCNREKLPGTTG
jgi:hypothetical protein